MVVSCIIMLIYAKLIFEKRSDRKSGGAADQNFFENFKKKITSIFSKTTFLILMKFLGYNIKGKIIKCAKFHLCSIDNYS